MLIALCQSHVLLQLSVFYHHEENEASYAVWLSCSKYVDYSLFTLSEWLICISSYTLFTRMVCSSKSERAQTKETAHPRGVASHPIHRPLISPWLVCLSLQICTLRAQKMSIVSLSFTFNFHSWYWRVLRVGSECRSPQVRDSRTASWMNAYWS